MSFPETRVAAAAGEPFLGRVAVVIPAYNHAQFVAEVVVVDDGSQDGTEETIRSVLDPRVRLIRYSVSKGPSAARNAGWNAAHSRWVFFLDADDTLPPDALVQLLKTVEKNQPGKPLKMPYGYQEVYAEDFSEAPRFTATLSTRTGSLLGDIAVNYRASIFVALIPRGCLEAMDGFEEALRYGEDFDFALRLAKSAEFQYIPVATYRARMHASNRHRAFQPESREHYVASVRQMMGRGKGFNRWWIGKRALAHQYWIMGQAFAGAGDWRRAREAFGRSWRECPWKLGAFKGWMHSLLHSASR